MLGLQACATTSDFKAFYVVNSCEVSISIYFLVNEETKHRYPALTPADNEPRFSLFSVT